MKFFFKAEANTKIGGGHLHRCISIAKEVITKGHEVAFIFADSTVQSKDKIRALNWPIFQINKSQELSVEPYLEFIPKGSFILFDTDNPEFYSGTLINELRSHNITTACYTITDQFPIDTDILVNTNVVSKTHTYHTPNYTQQIIGSEYLIFNEQFRKEKIFPSVPSNQCSALVFLGNADFNQITTKVLTALTIGEPSFDHVNILIGGLNPNAEAIKKQAATLPFAYTIHHNISDLKPLYQITDVAITAAGMTMWEMALYKIPQLVIASSPREATYTNYLNQHHYIKYLGEFSEESTLLDLNSKLRSVLIHSELNLDGFKDLLDPNGIEKMVSKFIEYSTK